MAGWATLYQIDRISIRGGIGVGLLMALVVAGVLESLPVLRWPVLVAMAVGLIVALSWILSRRRRPLESRTPPLSLGLYEGRRRQR
jgi:membrane protein implicated in regulation of membrane protease activity